MIRCARLGLTIAVGLLACGGETSERMTPASGVAPAAPLGTTTGDARVAAIADAAHSALIEQARVAWGRGRNEELRHFAEQQVERHTALVMRQSRAESAIELTPSPSDASSELHARGQQEVARLLAANHDDFDALYLDTQLKWHRELLELFDEKVLPNAENPALRNLLRQQRDLLAAQQKQLRQLFDRVGPPPFGPNPATTDL